MEMEPIDDVAGQMENVEAGTSHEIRRSARQNLGQQPSRYEEWDHVRKARNAVNVNREMSGDMMKFDNENENVGTGDNNFDTNSIIGSHNTTTEFAIAKQIADLDDNLESRELETSQLELEANRRQLELEAERKKIARAKELLARQLELEKAKNEELLDNQTEYGSIRDDKSFPSHRTYDVDTSKSIINENKNVSGDEKLSQILAKSFENFTDAMSKVLDFKDNEKTPVKTENDDDMKKYIARQKISKDLPNFHGNAEEWPSFINRFRTSTLSCGFNDVENMDRLQKCLKGKAKDAVQSMMYAPQNVHEIMETLELTFGRTQHVIKSLIYKTKMMKSPCEDKPETLIEFSNAIRNLVSTMEALNYVKHLSNPQLLEDLVGKLPSNMKMKWGKKLMKMQGEESLKDLSAWLKEIALAASYIQHIEPCSEEKKTENTEMKYKLKDTVESSVHAKSQNSFICLFCEKSGHEIIKCRNFGSISIDERWNFVLGKKLCYNFLSKGHHSSQCKRAKVCGLNDCKFIHHRLLHNDKKKEKSENIHHVGGKETSVLHMICPVVLTGPNGKINTYALLDGGAIGTFIDNATAKRLGLKGEKADLNLKWFNPTMMTDKDSSQVCLKISTDDETETFELSRVRTLKNMDLPCQTLDIKSLSIKWNHLKEFMDLSFVNAKPTILIGEDNSDLILVRKNVEGEAGGPIASKTKFGWVIHGNSSKPNYNTRQEFIFHSSEQEIDELHEIVKESFSLESLGVKIVEKKLQSTNDIKAWKIINEKTHRVGDRWETGLLWKSEDIKLPASKKYAFMRLRSMEKKMDKEKTFTLKYCEKISEYLEKGYARKLNAEEVAVETNKTWYLPHFGVINPNKPKLRFVFDAAAKTNGQSLNDVFTTHRLGEILETTQVSEWRWVDTENNVVDDGTRINNIPLNSESRWFNGPEFLKFSEEMWPKQNKSKLCHENNVKDDVCEYINVVIIHNKIIDLTKYSSLTKITRITSWILRFVHNCRAGKEGNKKLKQELSVAELNTAEKTLIQQSQHESFAEEMYCLQRGKPISMSSKIKMLCPALTTDGIMILQSRIEKSSEIDIMTKQPTILDPKNNLTRLIIDYYHNKFAHSGQETVVNELRQRYWIIDIRTAVRSAWNRCRICKLRRTIPQPPQMGLLPTCRVTKPPRPFYYTGLDYFGPIEITVGRRHEKRYGVLFTCLSVRAIHLEIAESLTTDSAIMATRRFIARRGQPYEIFSDNGTNFHGANNELKKALMEFDHYSIETKMSMQGITWRFNPPSAPHMGGTWERMIRSVKTALQFTLKEQFPKEETLSTLFAEAESVINSHPLTYVSVCSDDMESLTPNHFLLGSSSTSLPAGAFTDSDLCIKRRWRYSQRLADLFWKRWIHEYLPALARRSKWQGKPEPIKEGDLVIIADGNLERNLWPKGIVLKVYPESDGQVRVADIKTQFGIFKRPVVKLCLLDVDTK